MSGRTRRSSSSWNLSPSSDPGADHALINKISKIIRYGFELSCEMKNLDGGINPDKVRELIENLRPLGRAHSMLTTKDTPMTPHAAPITPNSSPLTPPVAIIGAGYWGRNLIRNFHQLGALKTICDVSLPILKEVRDLYPDVTVTDSLEVTLHDEVIQGIIIAAPAALHFDLTRKALLADKHVFVEKPLALDLQRRRDPRQTGQRTTKNPFRRPYPATTIRP